MTDTIKDVTEVKTETPNKSQQARRPWQPSSILKIPKKFLNSNYTYRWVTGSREGNMRKKLSEGWEIDKDVSKKMMKENYLQESTALDGKSPDGALRMREMTLMRMTKETAEKRREYYRDKSVAAKNDAQANYEDQMEGRGYGKVKYK